MAWFGPRTRQRPRNARPTRPGRYRPVLEPLEDRLAPAIFTVNTPTDTGFGIGLAGDLRYCLTQANATSGLDIIRFNIPGSGLHTINVTSELPSIFDPVVLDGYSQPGSSPNTLAVGDNAVLTIELNGSGAGAAAQGLALFSAGSTVRGLVINRFAFNGIYLSPAADGNTIEGNFLGTDPSGTVARGNGGSGISVDNAATNNTLGGTTPAARNLISGNQLEGIFMSGPGNVVQGNYLGTDVTGTVAQGNIADGVFIGGAATNNVIGGTEPGAGNVIAYNRKGVVLTGTATTGNRILGNAIFANAAMGIDLGDDGVTLNDASGHSGPNNFQNFPVLTQVTASGNGRTVFGHLRSTPNTTFALDFFANAAFDPSGYGQGEVYLGSVTVTTDASGFAAFSFAYVADPAQPFLTSTATDPAGNTSEFSGRDLPPVFNVPGPQQTLESVPLTINASVGDADSDGADTFQVTLTVSHGILTIPSLAGLTGTGNGTANLTYTGTLDALLSAVGAGVIYTPDAGFEGTDTLFLTVNDLVARELGGPGITTSSIAITTHRTALRSLTVGDVTGTVGQAIPLLIQASTADTDVPETLSIEISGLPAGATLSAGTDEGNGVWRLTVDQLNGLTLTIPDSFSGTLTVTATTTLVATGATATTKRTFVVNATTPPSAVLSPPPSPAPAVEVPVFVPKAVPAPVPVSLAPLLEPLLLGPTVTAVLSRASSQSAPPVLPPPLPSGISPDPKTVLAPVAAGQVREVITVGGEPTPVISNTQAILLVVSVQNEFGSLLDARSNVTVPSANSVAILQMRSPILPVRPRTDEGVATGAETEALLPITRVVAATLDGDDSVQLVEALLRGSETPVVAQAQRIAAGNPAPAVPVALPGPAPVASNPICVASADEPGLLGQTLKWLAFPVGVAVLAAGWFWNRRRRKAAEKSLTGSLRCETPPPNPLP